MTEYKPSNSAGRTPPIDTSEDDLLIKANPTTASITESVIDVTNSIIDLSPPQSSDEKNGYNTSSTSKTSSMSSSMSSSASPENKSSQKKPSFSSPPPQAFQSLPLASGTIYPPSFTTPMKVQQPPEEKKQVEDSVKTTEDEEEEAINSSIAKNKEGDDIIVRTSDTNLEVTSSPTLLSNQSNAQNYGSLTAVVKGIDEYLPESTDEADEKDSTSAISVNADITAAKESNQEKNMEEFLDDNMENKTEKVVVSNEEGTAINIKTESNNNAETPKTGNMKFDSAQEDGVNNKAMNQTDSIGSMTNPLMRSNSDTTIQVTNETKRILDAIDLSSSPVDDDEMPPYVDIDESVTSSTANSNTRSLLPRSLDLSSGDESNGFRPGTLRGRGFVNIGSGGAASILSSQESSRKESTEERMIQNDMGRMRHLGMLLDRHHHQINTRRRNNTASEPWWQNEEDDSSIERSVSLKEKNSVRSAESSNLEPMSTNSSDRSSIFPSKSVLTTGYKQSSVVPSGDSSMKTIGRKNSITSGDSIQDLNSRKNNDSLFENFDKTWQSFHEISNDDGERDTPSLDTPLAREQICFASMVLVLLQQLPTKTPDAETFWSKSIPIDIVKFFWKEVIFGACTDNSGDVFIKLPHECDVISTTEKIADALLNKLRYVSIDTSVSSNSKRDEGSSKSIKLSHDVYADYSKHILKQYNLLPENCVNRWNAKFVSFLRNVLDSHFDLAVESTSKVSKQVLIYAASYIPKLLLLSTHPELSHNNDIDFGLHEHELLMQQKERFNYLISLMKDSTFLRQRMKVLGGGIQEERHQEVDNDQLKRRFQSESYVDRIVVDVLKATKVHIEDLESITNVFSMMPKEVFVHDNGVILECTDSALSLYKAWKEVCLKLLQQKGFTDTPCLVDDPVIVKDPVANSFDRSRGRSGPIIQAAEHAQRTLPKSFRLDSGDYDLSVLGCTASIKKNEAIDLNNQKANARRSRHQESKEKSCAKMRLSHVLQIDPVHLYHYLSIGKSIHLLGKSIFESTYYSAENCPSSRSSRTLLGASPNATSISFVASSIDVYIQLTHVMSFILSNDIGDVDEDDLIDMGYRYDKETGNIDPSLRMRNLLQDRTEARVIFEKLNILCAEGWLDLGTYLFLGLAEGYSDAIETAGLHLINRLDKNEIKDVEPSYSKEEERAEELDEVHRDQANISQHQFQSKSLLCFQMALGVLLHNTACTPDETASFKTELTSVVIHARNLRASIIHAIGVHYYEQEDDYERAQIYLDSSLSSRRLLLRLLQRDDPDDLGSLSGSSMTRGYKRRYQNHSRRASTRQKRKPKVQENQIAQNNRIDVILSFEMNRKRQIALIEKGLSTTLEFTALASHCLCDYDASLSSFQEALILAALHSGKESLEVATLQYNMGVVHDDLAQHEASLGRYGESLRVRYSLLGKLREKIVFEPPINSSMLEFLDLEASVILTLRCMGNVYRALKDATNAIGCLMKAIELLKDKLKRGMTRTKSGLYQSADGDLGFGKGMMKGLPMPKIILDELRGDENITNIHMTHSQNLRKQADANRDDEAMRKEINSMYKTIISLLQERTAQRSSLRLGVKSGYTSSASSYTAGSFSSSNRSNNSSRSKNANVKTGLSPSSDNDSIHLDSTFNLGLLSLHFDDQKNALSYFEDALRTLWTTFSGESSGESSDSDYSKSSASRSSMKKRQKKIYFEGQVEEGALYHALAIAHASLSDHERAVRCYVTALRYYRRRFGLECTIVAGALYDCAFSYWKLGENERAEDFWADCLKILLCGGEKTDNNETISSIHDLHVARTLYNLAAAKICKGEYHDPYVSTCLNDAKSIFRRLAGVGNSQNFNVEIGHCLYYSAFVHYKEALGGIRLQSDGQVSETSQLTLPDSILETSCKEQLKNAQLFVDESLHNYLTENRDLDIGLEQVEVGQKVKHPMQAHIAHLSAWIHDALGLTTQAQWNYKVAIRLLNKVYTPDNLYTASAMHSLANSYLLTGNANEALTCYKEALMRRAQLLGSDHAAVADTLFKMAGIIGSSPHYTKAASMFAHCLRIRILTEGNDGENVADTLLNFALLHDKNGQYRKAQDCLEGALRVRKSRLQSIIHSCIANVEQSVENETNDTVDCVQRRTRVEQIKLAYILHNLGNILLKMGDTSEALTYFNEALDMRRKLVGIDNGGFAMFVARNDFESALELNRGILRDMADTLHNLGGVYESQSMEQKALSCYNQALIIKRSTSKEKQVGFSLDDQIKSCNTLSSAFTLLRIGAIHNELHNHDVSLSYYKSAVDIQRQHLGRDHISVAQTLVDMGLILRRQMESPMEIVPERTPLEQAANKYFNEALRISKLCHGPDHISVAGIMYHIGSMYDLGGNYMQAMNHYQHSANVYGREYAKTLCRSLFNVTSIQRTQYDCIVDNDHGLFHPTTFRNNLSPIESNTSVVLSRGIVQNSTRVADIDRDAYLRASLALAQVATKSGFVWMHASTFQNFVLRILHFIATNGIDPIRDTLQTNISYLMNNVAKASNHAVVNLKDTPQSNFLYLINE